MPIAYESIFVKKLKMMCPQNRWTQLASRQKRFVDLLILIIVISIVASVSLGVGGTATAAVNSAKLNSLENREIL
ncbi:unnamed protein product, partial [Allacma fusca]